MDDTDLSEFELSQLERLDAFATAAPWRAMLEGRDHESGSDFIQTAAQDLYPLRASSADLDLIAAMRCWLAAILRDVWSYRRFGRTSSDEAVSESALNTLEGFDAAATTPPWILVTIADPESAWPKRLIRSQSFEEEIEDASAHDLELITSLRNCIGKLLGEIRRHRAQKC
jgi:hypothetical protein